MIKLTDTFKEHVTKMLNERDQKNPNSLTKSQVVLDITTTGCSGLAYTFTFKDVPLSTSSGESDFEVTPKAFAVLDGATIDYAREGLSWGIKIINPNETAKCGCGESFSV